MNFQGQLMTRTRLAKNCLKIPTLLLFCLFIFYCPESYGQSDNGEKEFKGFSTVQSDVQRIAQESRDRNIPFDKAQFPQWTLEYDGPLEEGFEVSLSMSPEGAFQTSPKSISITKERKAASFTVSVVNAKLLVVERMVRTIKAHLEKKKVFDTKARPDLPGKNDCEVYAIFVGSADPTPINLSEMESNHPERTITVEPKGVVEERGIDSRNPTRLAFGRKKGDKTPVKVTLRFQAGDEWFPISTFLPPCGESESDPPRIIPPTPPSPPVKRDGAKKTEDVIGGSESPDNNRLPSEGTPVKGSFSAGLKIIVLKDIHIPAGKPSTCSREPRDSSRPATDFIYYSKDELAGLDDNGYRYFKFAFLEESQNNRVIKAGRVLTVTRVSEKLKEWDSFVGRAVDKPKVFLYVDLPGTRHIVLGATELSELEGVSRVFKNWFQFVLPKAESL